MHVFSAPRSRSCVDVQFGLAIMVMAFDFGPVSGGHINPAVSWAMLITRNQDAISFCAYVVAQLIGAFLGALCGRSTSFFILPWIVALVRSFLKDMNPTYI